MASENEPAKLLLPYLQRADELQKHEPLVAYYCRLYAMERGLKIPENERTQTTNSLLISLMKQLEKDKKSLQLGPEDNLYLEGFALNVFGKAEKQDRAGRADLTTAKTFYAASIFFEILNQFGVVQPDLEQKQKYAAWKAADIRKALKEGRKPQAGPPAGDDDLSLPSSGMSGSYDLGPSDAAVTSPGSQSDPSPQFHDEVNRQHSIKSAPPQFQDQHSSNITPYEFHDDAKFQRSTSLQSPPKFHDEVNSQHSTNNASPPPQSYPTAGYSSHDFHPPPPTNRPETSDFSQPYHRQSYSHEPQQPLPPNYPPHESNYPYPNFQSYPSFTETNIPAVSSHYPSYYQGSDPSYSPQSAPSTTDHPSTAQYQTSNRNGTVSEPTPAPPPAKTYQYDSSYQPSPEKIDNISAMALATNPILHSKAKHIEIDCHFVRERVQQGTIMLQFVNSSEQFADILTKGLCFPLFSSHCHNLMLANAQHNIEGEC